MSAEQCTLIKTNRIKALQRKRLCELRNNTTIKRLRITGKQTIPSFEMSTTVTSASQSSLSWINSSHGIYIDPKSSTAHLYDPVDDYVLLDVNDDDEEEMEDAPPIPYNQCSPAEDVRKKRATAKKMRNEQIKL